MNANPVKTTIVHCLPLQPKFRKRLAGRARGKMAGATLMAIGMNSTPQIRFLAVRKKFGASTVLDGVDFDVAPGQFLGLAGVNGAGKTTLIKCLLDFIEPDSGSIELNGTSFREHRSRRTIAYLPERFIPPYFLSGREFISNMLNLYGQPYDSAQVASICEELDFSSEALQKPVRSLSKGMTQKLGLAVCFLSRRDVYILDEPMSGLDPIARVRVKRLLARLRGERRTVLLTSHSLPDIEEICDHMVILHKGRVAWKGVPSELRDRSGGKPLEAAFLECIESCDQTTEAERIH